MFFIIKAIISLFSFFFFQAEDGIRDADVTGVQTCALPISWCGEGGGGFTGTPEDLSLVTERFREMNFAVDRLKQLPHTAVYIDSGHSAWQQINDYDAGYGVPSAQLGMASRLLQGGIEKADGFFLNVSNYRSNAELVDYGTRLSSCLSIRETTGATSCSDADLASVGGSRL